MAEKIELRVADPDPTRHGTFFACILELANEKEGLSENEFQIIKDQIEFRRRCSNQGFDNLLELIEMSKSAIVRAAKGITKTDTPTAKEPIA